MSADAGRLLSGEDLLDALRTPNRIFKDGSWDPSLVLGAGYSVRLGGDLLVIPDGPGKSKYTAVTQENRVSEFTLAPGDSALISTIERFCFDLDVTATIGDKFSLSAKGLLILHGAAVHPGYGRDYDSGAELWIPKADERLYFIVANVGPVDIHMREGDTIAYLQFFNIAPNVDPKPVSNVGFEYLSRLFRADHDTEDGGLAYFRNVKDLRHELEADIASLKEQVRELEAASGAEVAKLNGKVEDARTAVDRVTNASNTVVIFGVFLVGVTLLGFVLTSISDLIDKLPDHMGDGRFSIVVTLAVAYGLSCIAGVAFVARAAWLSVSGKKDDAKREKK